MVDPLPPVSCGSVEEYVRGVVNKTLNLDSVPQEARSNSMAILYRPNNLRRQMVFSLNNRGVEVLSNRVGWRVGRRNGLFFCDIGRVLLQVGRRKVTAVWNQRVEGKKEWFRFEGSLSQVVGGVEGVKERIRGELDGVLLDFVRGLGGVPGEIVWERAEECIKGDGFLDGLDRGLVVHDTVFKKVYGDEVEFLTCKGGEAGVFVKNYLRNRALEDLSPELVRALDGVSLRVEEPLLWLQGRVGCVGDVLLPECVGVVGRLTDRERLVLSEWFFSRFGRKV